MNKEKPVKAQKLVKVMFIMGIGLNCGNPPTLKTAAVEIPGPNLKPFGA